MNLTNLDQDSFTGRSYKQLFVVRGILFEVLAVKISYAMQKLDYTVYVSRVTSCKIDLWISHLFQSCTFEYLSCSFFTGRELDSP